RSIYNLWRQVLEYFDAFLIGLTATPSKQTLGFFNKNLVMEYSRQRAVADKVNVDGEVYRIRTQVTEAGSRVDAGYWVGKRDRQTRAERWEQLDDDLVYTAKELDRDVVAPDQIRLIVRTLRDRLFSDLFPGRTVVPKMLFFAKDDSHAETIVAIVREEFGKGNDFCQKITYRVSGRPAEELIAEFRNSYNPRVAVTVDMIATGTDIKPLEVLVFLRSVKSRILYEQMLGRGTRVISANDLSIVTHDAPGKDRFVIVDAVGVTEQPKFDPQGLERKRSVPFAQLLQAVATGAYDGDTLSSLAGRLAALDRKLDAPERYDIELLAGGRSPSELANVLLDALDPDRHLAAAQAATGVEAPDPEAVAAAAGALMQEAACLLADNPRLRKALVAAHQHEVQIIDTVTQDVLKEAGYDASATESAHATVQSFREFLEANKDEITALQLLYSRPYGQRGLTYRDIEELARALQQPPHSWTTEKLWQAYAQLEKDKVRGAGSKRLLTDLISLVRHALQIDPDLAPYPERVAARYQQWLEDQAAAGRTFTAEQRWWLDKMAEQVGVNLSVQPDDLDVGEFYDHGGRMGAIRTLGSNWLATMTELNSALRL
ncbi:MAG: type I restriction-modification enzyme R subunit C-terminal domain-containing protein, partial [Caldilineaceae bacterium]